MDPAGVDAARGWGRDPFEAGLNGAASTLAVAMGVQYLRVQMDPAGVDAARDGAGIHLILEGSIPEGSNGSRGSGRCS